MPKAGLPAINLFMIQRQRLLRELPILYQGSNTSYVHTGLTNGIGYYYRVCAADNAGNESWGVYARAMTPLSVPTGLHITGYVNRGINISWNPNLNEAVAGYRIDYRPTWAPGGINAMQGM